MNLSAPLAQCLFSLHPVERESFIRLAHERTHPPEGSSLASPSSCSFPKPWKPPSTNSFGRRTASALNPSCPRAARNQHALFNPRQKSSSPKAATRMLPQLRSRRARAWRACTRKISSSTCNRSAISHGALGWSGTAPRSCKRLAGNNSSRCKQTATGVAVASNGSGFLLEAAGWVMLQEHRHPFEPLSLVSFRSCQLLACRC